MPPPEELPEMPFLRNIGFVMTLRCQVACPHCILEAGPHRTEEMQVEQACTWIDQVAAYRKGYVKVLSLTGGEPFIDLDALRRIAGHGERRGLLVSVVTNASWATSEDEAVHILQDLSAIRMIAISADAYHQEAIPFERVKNAISAARICDIPYNVHVCTQNEADPRYRAILRQLREVTEDGLINTAVTFPAGRALARLESAGYERVPDPPVSACSAGASPMVFPDGRVTACIGPVIDLARTHPLLLGNLREEPLQEIFDRAQENVILHAIRLWGPRKLVTLIAEAGMKEILPESYIRDSVCNACYSLMARPEIVEYLGRLAQDPGFFRYVAYGRAYFLKEPEMAQRLISREKERAG